MNKATLWAIVFMSALGACDRGNSHAPATGTPPASADAGASARNAAASARRGEEATPPFGDSPSAGADASGVPKVMAKVDPRDAEAKFVAAPKVKLQGEARLNLRRDGVRVDVDLSEGPPGTHGIHIHEKPDCSDIAGKSMGEHLAPDSKPHGLPTTPVHHLGDLGNIEIAPNGTAHFEIVVPNANVLEDHDRSLLNRAIVIHEKRDVGESGRSGSPIACAAFVGG